MEASILDLSDVLAGIRRVVPADQFIVRLDDEIYRAERYNIALCLIVAEVPDAAADLAKRLVDFAGMPRRIDLIMSEPGRFRVCLMHTDLVGAERFVRRLRKTLPEATVSIAAFPEDGQSSEELFNSAQALLDFRRTSKPSLRVLIEGRV